MVRDLPQDVTRVFEKTLSCEMTTMAKSGPVTWPMVTLWKPDDFEFIFVSGVGMPTKLYNLHRDSRVSLLFSEFAGSGLHSPPEVLVQGRATVPDEVLVADGLEDIWEEIFRRRPSIMNHYALDTEERAAIPLGLVWRVRVTVSPER